MPIFCGRPVPRADFPLESLSFLGLVRVLDEEVEELVVVVVVEVVVVDELEVHGVLKRP